MWLPEADVIRLRHMLDAAEQALRFRQGRSRAELGQDPMLRFALLHAVTIVGEAASTQTSSGLRSTTNCPSWFNGSAQPWLQSEPAPSAGLFSAWA